LTETERKRLEWFFSEKLVAKNDAKQSMHVLRALFKDIRMPEGFENRLVESFIKTETVSSFHYNISKRSFELNRFLEIMTALADETPANLIFDLYSGFSKVITHDAVVAFLQAFGETTCVQQFESRKVK
jgi:hypothetical protein